MLRTCRDFATLRAKPRKSNWHPMDIDLMFFDPTPTSDEGMHISVPATNTLLALAQDPLLWTAARDPRSADSPEVDCAQAVPAAGPGPTCCSLAAPSGSIAGEGGTCTKIKKGKGGPRRHLMLLSPCMCQSRRSLQPDIVFWSVIGKVDPHHSM